MSIVTEILEWSQSRPGWQRDAMRRFVTSQAFTEEDENQVYALLKAEHGLPVDAPVTPLPLEAKHLPADASDDGPVQLASVGDVKCTNRLAKDQTLKFTVSGLTAIYGDNGSGKSGYVRILKRACRTREADPVLPDIFKPAASQRPSAVIRYRVSPSDPVIDETWNEGQEAADALSQLSVFDSRIATITVDKANELSFLPFGLDVVEKLGELCGRLKDRLNDERNALNRRISDIHQAMGSDPATEAILGRVSAKTSDENIAQMSAWSDAQEKRLAGVVLMLTDSVRQAKALRARKARCEAVLNQIRSAAGILSPEALVDLRQKAENVKATREAVRMKSVESFSGELLQGVGSEAWRVMYEAARKFSVEYAYLDRPFPAVEETGDRCVLCLQPLDDPARDRFLRFEAFVIEEVEKQAEVAGAAYSEGIVNVAEQSEQLVQACQDLETADPDDEKWAGDLLAVGKGLAACAAAILNADDSGDWASVPETSIFNAIEFEKHLLNLEEKAASHEQALEPERRRALDVERNALQAQKKLAENKAALTLLRDLLKQDASYDPCLRATAANTVTTLKKKLDEAYVQDSLRENLKEELEALRFVSAPVNLNFQTKKAKTVHSVELDGAAMREAVGKVISEGEYRALALACFLAQVRHQSKNAGIIVDDPVSSLDHDRRELVAGRLAREALRRQVVVFTHDLVFFYMLKQKLEEHGAHAAYVNLRRASATECGVVEDAEPWKAKQLKERVHHLENIEIKALSAINDQTSDEYRRAAIAASDMIRKTWERLVEEVVLNGVVIRLDQAVHTQQLDGVDVSDDVVNRIWWQYTKVSNWAGHDETMAKNSPLPTPDDLKDQIVQIQSCKADIEALRKASETRRKGLRKSKPGEFV